MSAAGLQTRRDNPPSVLLVEDNPADANLVEEALLEAGLDCELQVVADGSKAVEVIALIESGRAPVPDLVMLDLNLPRIGGHEVLRRLRMVPSCQNVKVLVVTSSDAPMDRKRVMELGATDYFRKPSSLQEFFALGTLVSAILGATSNSTH